MSDASLEPVNNDRYVVATLKSWNVAQYERVIRHYPGEWHLVTDPRELTVELLSSFSPKYVFFPHWSEIVPTDILELATCVGFHETDLPFGRGGSPIQNLIARGHKETMISALQMSNELDAGPIYLKEPLSLDGLAEDIFARAAETVAGMIKTIVVQNPIPVPQQGPITVFKRRTPSQSRITDKTMDLGGLFDHVRMLDAEGYPKAFLEFGGLRLEFTQPHMKSSEITARVRISAIQENIDD